MACFAGSLLNTQQCTILLIIIIIIIIIMKNFNMVTMAQRALNWRNMHTHVDRITHIRSHTYINTVTTTWYYIVLFCCALPETLGN